MLDNRVATIEELANRAIKCGADEQGFDPYEIRWLCSTIRDLERERDEARAVIEWADHHYANHDMSHKDFRVEVAQRCADFLEKHASVAADAGAEDQALEAAKAEAFKAGMMRAAEIAEAIMTTADGKFDLQVLRARQGEDNLELAAACAAGMSHAAREIATAIRAEAERGG